jgi:hypothetical protein
MNHLEIKIHKINKPQGLAVIQGLWLAEVLQIFMIGKCLDGKRGSMEIVVPGFKGADNSKEFLDVDVIDSFGWAKDCER